MDEKEGFVEGAEPSSCLTLKQEKDRLSHDKSVNIVSGTDNVYHFGLDDTLLHNYMINPF